MRSSTASAAPTTSSTAGNRPTPHRLNAVTAEARTKARNTARATGTTTARAQYRNANTLTVSTVVESTINGWRVSRRAEFIAIHASPGVDIASYATGVP